MKQILICICIISLALITLGCDLQYINGDATNLPLQTANAMETSIPLDNATTTSNKDEDNICLTVDGKRINLYFDMAMETAINMLTDEGVEHKRRDDVSVLRSWSGHRLVTPAFELIFDLQGLLHEIIIKEGIDSNLPIMVDDLIIDMYDELGEESFSRGYSGSSYNEYLIDFYYLKAFYNTVGVPREEYIISKIIISKYSVEQYKEIVNPAVLILTNENGDEAEFFIGMSVDEVKAQLDMLDLGYWVNNGVLSGDSYDYVPDAYDPPPDGYSFMFYFNIDSSVHTLDIYGPGAMTQLGLQGNDTAERMIELHGNNYIKKEFDNDYWNQYSYVCGDNYLDISTDSELDPLGTVSVLSITRFTESGLMAHSFIGIE